MEPYFDTLTDEELVRDRAQLSMLKQILEQPPPSSNESTQEHCWQARDWKKRGCFTIFPTLL